MPLAERDSGSRARRQLRIYHGSQRILAGAVLVLVGVLVSLALVHCPKGIVMLNKTATSGSVQAHSAPLAVANVDSVGAGKPRANPQGGTCASADVGLSVGATHGARVLLPLPTVAFAFAGPPVYGIGTDVNRAYRNVNPLAAPDGRSLLYRLNVIRR